MRRLVLLGEQEQVARKAGLPLPWGVLYAPPNPDGSRKNCLNCRDWMHEIKRCRIHGPEMEDPPNAVCGYHVYGRPTDETTFQPNTMFVTPEISGWQVIEGGTSCDICIYYTGPENEPGECSAVADPKTLEAPAKVHGRGCCARWDQPGTPAEALDY